MTLTSIYVIHLLIHIIAQEGLTKGIWRNKEIGRGELYVLSRFPRRMSLLIYHADHGRLYACMYLWGHQEQFGEKSGQNIGGSQNVRQFFPQNVES